MNIVSIDIKAAYDNVDHLYLFRMLDMWVHLGYLNRTTLSYIRFLFNQYKIGVVERKGGRMNNVCLINKGLP